MQRKFMIPLFIFCLLLIFSLAAAAVGPGEEEGTAAESGSPSGVETAAENGNEEVIPEPPVIVTTCGQSPGALMVRLLSNRIKLECQQDDLLTAAGLEDNVYKTLIITMGTSVKGMGAAGTDIDAEVKRIKELVEEARRQEIIIIGAHIEGMARRVDRYDELSIETVTPVSDIIIVKSEVDHDKYFTNMAAENGVPIYYIEETLDLEGLLKDIFNLE